MLQDSVSKAVTGLMIMMIVLQFPFTSVRGEPSATEPAFGIKRIFTGHFEPSTMAFLGTDDLLVLDRDNGKVFRIINGIQSKPLLDVNVATDGYRGLLGIAVSSENDHLTNVFLYFTEARGHDGDDTGKNAVNPLGNRIYKYLLEGDKLVNPELLIDLPALPGPRHAGGVLAIGPDNNLYFTIGDLDGTFRYKQFETTAQNFKEGKPADGRSGILVITKDGQATSKDILGNTVPLKYYYAYGIRNSFGIDWDPLKGNLWDSENGPNFGDEINLVPPGFNSGWASIQGYWKPDVEEIGPEFSDTSSLVDFGHKGIYSNPEFVWLDPAAPSAIKFLDTDKYGNKYENDLFVGDANNGNIYNFKLDEQRKKFNLSGKLSDNIADNMNEVKELIFAKGFGKVTDMKVGPDGYLYVLSTEEHSTNIYQIIP